MPLTAVAPLAAGPTLDLPLHPRQEQALYVAADEVLYGGAAAGGKSYLLRVATIVWCLMVAGFQAYLFRRHYADLMHNHMQGANNYHELLAPLVASGHCTIVERQVRFYNGSAINLCALQYKKDLDKYQGAEIHGLAIDEATHFKEAEFLYLRRLVRLGDLEIPPGLPISFPRIVMGSNPGGRGHHFFKKGFVDLGEYKITRMPSKDGGMLRVFIPARLEDNPTMSLHDPGFAARLEGLGDPALIAALRDGDWSIVPGSMFIERWRTAKHVIDLFPIPWHWPIWRGGDDGFDAPASVSWITQDPLGGSFFVICELYRRKMDASEFATRTMDIDRWIPRMDASGVPYENGEVLSGGMDTSAWADSGTVPNAMKLKSRGLQMNALGTRWRKIKKPDGARVQDVLKFQQLLATNGGDPGERPGIMFFRNCVNHIRTITALQRDDRNQFDVDKDGETHAWDSLRYGLSTGRTGSGTVAVAGL